MRSSICDRKQYCYNKMSNCKSNKEKGQADYYEKGRNRNNRIVQFWK